MWEDTIVTEVRSVRQAHAAKFGFDLRVIYADLKQQEQAGNRQIVSLPPKTPQLVHPTKRSVSAEA